MYFLGTTLISDNTIELCNRLIKIKVNIADTFPDSYNPKNDWAFEFALVKRKTNQKNNN